MVTFRVPDMTCGHCAATIARAIATVDGGARVDANIADRLVSVSADAAESELIAAMQEAGYKAQRVDSSNPQRTVNSSPCCCGSRKAQGRASDGPCG